MTTNGVINIPANEMIITNLSMQGYSPKIFSKDNYFKRIVSKIRGRPWFIWFISVVEIIVFIAQLSVNWSLTGIPIQIKPSFNPLIGPSPYVSIYMGARFAPCMYTIQNITDDSSVGFPCPNYTDSTTENLCTLSELCGFGGISTRPNQWYRFITAIFLHGGLVHIIVNILTQIGLGLQLEKNIGTIRLAIIYFASGIFGNVLGANFTSHGTASVGCSGSLMGLFPLLVLNLLYNWKKSSCCLLIVLILSIIINIGLGLLPMIDNFVHIGGFLMGLLLGVTLLSSPAKLRARKNINKKLSTRHRKRLKEFVQNHSKKWYLWWIIRFIALTIAIIIFVLSFLNIYLWKIRCNWCQYINCLPVNDWCDTEYLITTDTIDSSSLIHNDTTISCTTAQTSITF